MASGHAHSDELRESCIGMVRDGFKVTDIARFYDVPVSTVMTWKAEANALPAETAFKFHGRCAAIETDDYGHVINQRFRE